MTQHRWSGWPGAFCLDCGVEDALETCIGEHNDSIMCVEGHVQCEVHPPNRCTVHMNGPCLHPGEKLADPYQHNDNTDNDDEEVDTEPDDGGD